jgi:predicted AAA+ superfamily ATPase
MILESTLEQVIDEQHAANSVKINIKRSKQVTHNTKRILVVTGIRRCGKSTWLQQLNNNNEALVINFEDPRLEGFSITDFNKLEKIAQKRKKTTLLLDEVQNISNWEKYARSANERGVQIQITGSNASMLSRELGTHLTGRYQQVELYPFNYSEFLEYTNQQASLQSFAEYIAKGGFPEFLTEQNTEYLRTLLRDIIMRDIAVRRGIKNEHYLIRLAVHIISNVGKEFSYNNITKTLEIKSVRTTIDYCDYLQESYLVELIPLFSYSIHKQLANAKKAYCVDTALIKANSLSFSKDNGRLLENAVYIHLRRSYNNICYFKNEKSECDFLVKENDTVVQAVQVCYMLNDDNVKRELTGLKNAMSVSKCNDGIIITAEQEDEIEGIKIIPAWKWMLA